MEFSSIFHEPTSRFAYATEKNAFSIRIKTKKSDIQKIIFHSQDKYIPLDYIDSRFSNQMSLYASDSYYDYWEIKIKVKVICLRYFFEIVDFDGTVSFMGNIDFYENAITDVDLMFDLPQNLREEEIFTVPKWAKNKIMYQIFSSRYASSKAVSPELWYKENLGRNDVFSGDLKGITEHLEHIKELGADAIYFTPIFKSKSIHKYDIEDYYTIDSSLGTNEDFKFLVEKAHTLGIKIILDAVFNHTSRDFFAFADILKNGENSKYKNWYYIEDFPVSDVDCEGAPNLLCFSYYPGMPKLNLSNPETRKYFLDVASFWISEYKIDGWRLDVADEITHDFWQDFRKTVRAKNPEALIIGECWHYTPDFLDGTQWDSAMNYPFYNAVRNFIAYESISAKKFVESLNFIQGNYHEDVFKVLWNHIDNHDTPRFLHQAAENKNKQMLASAIQILWPGMPMIYYGDEYALTGAQDPDCRRGMPWDKDRQDLVMFEWYKKLISIRKTHLSFTEGNLVSTEIDEDSKTIVFKREYNSETSYLVLSLGKSKENPQILQKFVGKKDLLSDSCFDGSVKIQALAFCK